MTAEISSVFAYFIADLSMRNSSHWVKFHGNYVLSVICHHLLGHDKYVSIITLYILSHITTFRNKYLCSRCHK